MKILIISTVRPHKGSGSGFTEYAYQLIKHLRPLLSKSDSISNIYALNAVKKENIKGFIYTNTAFKRKLSAIPKQEYDIIHITDQELGFAAKILKKSGIKTKIVTTVHDLARFEKRLHRGVAEKFYNKLVKGSIVDAINYSDYILCNSTQTYTTIKERFPWLNNISIVQHGTDDKILNEKKHSKINKEFTIGYLGALSYHKNVSFILETAKLLRDDKKYKFVIYGTGAEERNLLEFKKKNNLENVLFKGYVSDRRRVKVYDEFDAFMFPSVYEGLGHPILEAHACGLPVIIYKYGKIPKEVRKYCFEAESPEHMAQIIENIKENGYSEKLRKRSTKHARRFTWEKCAKETLNIYKHAFN